jgi:hypothetical protein
VVGGDLRRWAAASVALMAAGVVRVGEKRRKRERSGKE